MIGVNKLQKKLLDDLYKRDILEEAINISFEEYELAETDDIMKVRELVYYIDQLVNMKMIDAVDYYIEAGMVSFEYMNKAVEIIEDRVKISKLGINYVEIKSMKRFTRGYNAIKVWLNKQFLDKPYKFLITHLIAFVCGVLAYWGVTYLI